MRDQTKLLAAHAKKNLMSKYLYDNCHNLTEQQIDVIPVERQWITQAAKSLRIKRLNDPSFLVGLEEELISSNSVQFYTKNEHELTEKMEVRIFNTGWDCMPTGRKMSIDANEKDIILLTNNNKMEYYFENTYGLFDENNWEYMLSISEHVGYATRPDYEEMVNNKNLNKGVSIEYTTVSPASMQQADETSARSGLVNQSDSLSILACYGVRIG